MPEFQLRRAYQINLNHTTTNIRNFESYVSKAEAARIIGTTNQTVANLVDQGVFTTRVVAGRTLVLLSEVENYVARPKGRPPKKETGRKESLKTIHKDSSEKYISQAQAARHRGVSDQAIANLIRRGRLTTVRVAGRTLVLRSEIELFVVRPKGRPPKKSTNKKASQKAKTKK
jgi:plasmid maintenance system antidote protein VapI